MGQPLREHVRSTFVLVAVMSVCRENSDAQSRGDEAQVVETSCSTVKINVLEQVTSTPIMSGAAKRRERKLRHEPLNVTAQSNPDKIQVMDFLEARSSELDSMLKALGGKGGSKRTFQKLPRHMRRRATSHNPKRLPRRFRDKAEKEVSKCACGRMCVNV